MESEKDRDTQLLRFKSDIALNRKRLYFHQEISRLISVRKPLNVFYRKFIDLLQQAFPENYGIGIRIEILGNIYVSGSYKENQYNLILPLVTWDNKNIGTIKLSFLSVYTMDNMGKSSLNDEDNEFIADALTRMISYTQYNINEEAVNFVENKISSLLESINEIIFETDLHYNIVFITPSVRAITLYEPNYFIGRNLSEIIYEEDISVFSSAQMSVQEGKKTSADVRLIRKDGERPWVRITINPNLYIAPENKYIGTIADLSGNLNLLYDLRSSELRYKSILDASPDVITITDLDGNIIFTSPKTAELYGVESNDEFIGHNVAEYLLPEQMEEAMENLVNFRQKKYTGNFEYKAVKIDGSVIDVDVRREFINDPDGKPRNIVFITRDITDRKQSQSRLKYQKRLQELLIDISNTYINLPYNKFTDTVNESLAKIGEFAGADRFYIFNYDFEKLTCTNTFEWCAPGIDPQIKYLQNVDLQELSTWVNTHISGKIMYIADVSRLNKDDIVRKALEPQQIKSLLTVPVMDGKECLGFAGFDFVRNRHEYSEDEEKLLELFSQMVVSVTKRYKNEIDLIKFRTISDQANYGTAISDMKGNLIYVNDAFALMHGWNSPKELVGKFLSAVHNEKQMKEVHRLIEIIRTEGGFIGQEVWHTKKDGKEFPTLMNAVTVKNSYGNEEFVSLTVTDITEAIEKNEHTISGFNPEKTDLNTLIRDVINSFKDFVAEGAIQFNSFSDKIEMKLDNQLITHIFQILLTNALKFSDRDPAIIIYVSESRDNIKIEVEDNGSGISGPFLNDGNAGDTEGDRSGFGIVMESVALHGGSVTVDSDEGRGSVFTVLLPKSLLI